MDAERALIVQNLGLSWRYSIGNPYEEFSFPESLDEAQVLAELGFFPESRTTLQVSFTRKPRPYPSWTMGEKLLASAVYARLSGDRRFLARATPTLAGYVAALRRRQEGSGPARAGALLLRHSRCGAGAPRPGGRLAGAARDRRGVGRQRPAGVRSRGPDASPDGSVPPFAVRSPRRRDGFRTARSSCRCGSDAGEAAVRHGDRVARGQLLEPRRAVCPRIGPLPAGQPRRDGGARLPRASWLAAPRPRPCRRLLALRAGSEPAAVRERTRSTG